MGNTPTRQWQVIVLPLLSQSGQKQRKCASPPMRLCQVSMENGGHHCKLHKFGWLHWVLGVVRSWTVVLALCCILASAYAPKTRGSRFFDGPLIACVGCLTT